MKVSDLRALLASIDGQSEVIFESRPGEFEMARSHFHIDEVRILSGWFVLTSVDLSNGAEDRHPKTEGPKTTTEIVGDILEVNPTEEGVQIVFIPTITSQRTLEEQVRYEFNDLKMGIDDIAQKHNVAVEWIRHHLFQGTTV